MNGIFFLIFIIEEILLLVKIINTHVVYLFIYIYERMKIILKAAGLGLYLQSFKLILRKS